MSIIIHNGDRNDIGAVTSMAIRMHKESRYKKMGFDVAKFQGLLESCINDKDWLFIVGWNQGAIVGGFIGFVAEHFFSKDLYSGDLGLYVKPDFRGQTVAAAMVRKYREWADMKGVMQEYITLGVSTGIKSAKTAQLYTALGFPQIGTLHAGALINV